MDIVRIIAILIAQLSISITPAAAETSHFVCDGCIDTPDIADGAITAAKLSPDLSFGRLTIYDANDVLIGVSLPRYQGESFLDETDSHWVYNAEAGFFMEIGRNGLSGISVKRERIYYDEAECSGNAYAQIGDLSGTPNILIGSGLEQDGITISRLFKTVPNPYHQLPNQNITIVSFLDEDNNNCGELSNSMQSLTSALVEEIHENPLPFDLPLKYPMRLQYVSP